MTLEEALTKSTEAAKEGKFLPAAFIKESYKLPIYAYSKTEFEYHLESEVGNVGLKCNFLLAKWKLRGRKDWVPRLKVGE